MGLRIGSYMSVWSTEPSKTGKTTRVRLSASRKNQAPGEYEQDFAGFCTFIGKAHNKAQNLQQRDRIKILECDVSNSYDKEKQKEYVNYKVFDFEMANGSASGGDDHKPTDKKKPAFAVDDGEVESDDDNLPF